LHTLCRSRPQRIENQNLGCNEFAVKAVADSVDTNGSYHQPHGVNLLTAMESNHCDCEGTEKSASEPKQCRKHFCHVCSALTAIEGLYFQRERMSSRAPPVCHDRAALTIVLTSFCRVR